MKKKLSLILAMGLTLSAVLSGCGGSAQETQPQTIAEATTAAPTEASAAAADGETEAAGGAVQELTFVLSNQPDGIDPGVTVNSFAADFLVNCFEGLVTYDKTGSVVPGNAESWDISDDGTVYTFHLRNGLKWSDGSDLTANDYVYALQRVLDPETAGQFAGIVMDYILNASEYYAGEATADDLGVKAIDDQTLELTIIQPTSYFIDVLTLWVFDPVQQATIEANGDAWTAAADTYICNGPFKITEMNLGESVVLEKNESYYNADNVTIEKITFRYIFDIATGLTAYESGEVDGLDAIPASDRARLKAEEPGFITYSSYGTTYYDINCAKAPYDNPLVRKALNLAIDRQTLIDNVVQNDNLIPAFGILPPSYMVNGKDITEGRSDYDLSVNADVEAAQAALAEAGYPNGEGFPTLQLSYYSSDTVKKIAEAIAEMLETNLGIDVEVTSNDWAVFYDAVQRGDYDVAAMGWGADYMHPMTFLPLLVTDDVNNQVFYSNPTYDALVAEAKAETDAVKAADLMMQAEAEMMKDYPLINLYYSAGNFLMKDYVKDVFVLFNGSVFFKDAYVE